MKKTLFLFICGMVFGVSALKAVPAYPKKVTTTQPDGTKIEVFLRGDENYHWAETVDGYTLLRDKENFWTFAECDAKGNVQASTMRFMGNTDIAYEKGIRTKLQPTFSLDNTQKKQPNKIGNLQVESTFPSTGKRNLLMLLVCYNGETPTFSQSDFNNYMNQKNYKGIGSFRDYYLEASGGLLDIETTVTPWITLSHTFSYYGSDGAIDMILEALDQIEGSIDLSKYDNDGDGVLDGLAVIHNGEGQETSGNAYEIWSHSSTIGGVSYQGISLGRYTIEPELYDEGVMSTIGVMCHEFGHNLGAPDFYDTDYNSSGGTYRGTGIWDLMGEGIWNDNGNRPAGMNIWQRWMLGWCDCIDLREKQSISDLPASSVNPVAYRMKTQMDGEYYIMENRQQTGNFDCALPASGLLIYHVSEDLVKEKIMTNTLNITHPQAVFTVCAGANSDPNEYISSYGQINTEICPFPGSKNITSFDDYSLPSTRSLNGRQSYLGLSNIAVKNGLVSFDFDIVDAPASPIQFVAEASKGEVHLSWEMPEEIQEQPKQFNIYRNDEWIASTTKKTYQDKPGTEGVVLNYLVDAEYEGNRVSPFVKSAICVPANRIDTLYYEIADDGVVLRWELDKTLTRLQDWSDFTTVTLKTDSIDICHRFTTEDLLAYKLSKIARVSFLSYTPPSKVAINARVWEADKNGENAVLASEVAVPEFATGMWRDVTLQKPVTIKANKEYWIGIQMKAKDGSLDLITDKGPLLGERGNWVRENDEWQESLDVTGNFYLYATISPYSPAISSSVPKTSEVVDPMLDLLYPIGYCIYKNGEQIGTSGNAYYKDNAPLSDGANYAVSCLYKGNNESVCTSEMVLVTDVKSASVANNSSAVCFDLSGRRVNIPAHGVYIQGGKKIMK